MTEIDLDRIKYKGTHFEKMWYSCSSFAVIFMKGTRDITASQRVCKMTSDDYVKFTLKRSVVSDAGTYCILARNAYGVDRAFITVVVRSSLTSRLTE